MTVNRKELVREYKQTVRPMGVFRVTNTVSGMSLVGSSKNLPAILNRHRAQLSLDSHSEKDFQRDWNARGADAFEFEVLDTLKPSDEPGYDPADDLKVLEQMWLDKLAPLSKRALR